MKPGLNAYTNNCVKKAVQDIVGVQFRNGATVGGSIYGRFGFSDMVTVFQAMDTYVELHKGGIIPLAQFAKMKYDRDVLVRIIVKKQPLAISYQAMRIQRTDFPVLTCAVSKVDGEYRAAIGARPGVAVVVKDTEGILTGGITPETAEKFAVAAAAAVKTDSNSRGSAQYRTHLAKVLTQRGTMEIGGQL